MEDFYKQIGAGKEAVPPWADALWGREKGFQPNMPFLGPFRVAGRPPPHGQYPERGRREQKGPYSKVILESLPLRILLFPKVVSDPLILSLHSPKFIYPDKQTRMSPDISTWLSHQPLKPNIVQAHA